MLLLILFSSNNVYILCPITVIFWNFDILSRINRSVSTEHYIPTLNNIEENERIRNENIAFIIALFRLGTINFFFSPFLFHEK